jgi:hypothetical protein
MIFNAASKNSLNSYSDDELRSEIDRRNRYRESKNERKTKMIQKSKEIIDNFSSHKLNENSMPQLALFTFDHNGMKGEIQIILKNDTFY